MDILNSEWLINMLEKSGKHPKDRMLSLFDILEDWIAAPSIRDSIRKPDCLMGKETLLQAYLVTQAKLAGASDPEILANQIYFTAVSVIESELASHQHNHFPCARNAAKAMIQAQTESISFLISDVRKLKHAVIALVGVFAIGFTFIYQIGHARPAIEPLASYTAFHPDRMEVHPEISPMQTAALLSSIEQMRKGNCQFPEALQIPDKDKSAYLNTVVGGQAPANAEELAIANYYLQKVRCNYTPILMENSVG